MPLRVLYLTGHPAESQLSAPIIRRMEADPYFEVTVRDVYRQPDGTTRGIPYPNFDWSQADVVVSPCDRTEMLVPTCEAFLQNKIVVRIYGGLLGSGTLDDTIRHTMDTMGHIHLVESVEAKQNLIHFGEEEWRIHPFGITHLDDVDLTPPSSPSWQRPFAMLLMNPTTVSEDATKLEMQAAVSRAIEFTKTDYVICFQPNGDLYSGIIRAGLDALEQHHPRVHVYRERIPRNEFLYYLSQCDLFISNSSATKYEFPALNSHGEVFNPSWRNAERTKPPPLERGGSDRIISALKQVDWSDREKLLRKRFRF